MLQLRIVAVRCKEVIKDASVLLSDGQLLATQKHPIYMECKLWLEELGGDFIGNRGFCSP
jgi:hypothetical protein